MKHFLGYFFFRSFETLLGILPFSILYIVSDGMSFLMKSVFKYRGKVIDENLKTCFPNNSKAELLEIKNKFYLNLTDIIVESFKGPFVKIEELEKRYKFINPELLEEYYNAQKDVMLVGSHYTNWEWGTYVTGKIFSHQVIGLYKSLKNPILNKHVTSSRESTGINMISIKDTHKIFRNNAKRKPEIYAFLSDQNPSNTKDAIWVDFLNRKTACLHGAEKYAKMYNLPVVFTDTIRTKRGHYELTLIPITDNPNELKDGEITKLFMKILENRILRTPENWLWSHRRWKHKFENRFER